VTRQSHWFVGPTQKTLPHFFPSSESATKDWLSVAGWFPSRTVAPPSSMRRGGFGMTEIFGSRKSKPAISMRAVDSHQ
jgi:hypothetical protein